MTITVTHDEVVEALTALAQENPDKVNPMRCVYTSPLGEHCIAGEIIVRLGGQVPEWGSPRNGTPIHTLYKNHDIGITLPSESVELLCSCQSIADQEATWGVAVEQSLTAGVSS